MKIRKLEWIEVNNTTVAVVDEFGVFSIDATGQEVPAFRWQHSHKGEYINAGYSESLEVAKFDAQKYFEKKARKIIKGIKATPRWQLRRNNPCDICTCKKPMKRDSDGLLIPCAHCLDDAIQKVITNLETIHAISKRQVDILNERRVNLIKIMEAKPNVRKITVK